MIIITYLIEGRKTCTLLLSVSDTYTLPDEESTARPSGMENWPLPCPSSPHWVINSPVLINFCTRWLPESVTYTLPSESNATTAGPSNCPGPDPAVPQEVMKSPSFENICIRLFPKSGTNTLSSELTETSHG